MILYTIPIFSQLETVMKHVLLWFHTSLHLPWAWAIVGTTVVVRMLLVPLTVKQIHSMQNLQRYAPQMKEIQKKYKGDKQKQNEELMKFYRENNINPAASCLPMLV
jgi:YidC/Oxa1 family membrane protein insertase